MVCVEYHHNMKGIQPPKGSYRFEAELVLVDDSQSVVLKPGYQPVINTTTTRQSCIIEIANNNNGNKSNKQQNSMVGKKSKSVDDRVTLVQSQLVKKEDYNKSNFSVRKKNRS